MSSLQLIQTSAQGLIFRSFSRINIRFGCSGTNYRELMPKFASKALSCNCVSQMISNNLTYKFIYTFRFVDISNYRHIKFEKVL